MMYQKILFCKNSGESLQEFALSTVTYGTSFASFLAIRTLHRLVDDEEIQHPIVAAVLKSDFYEDDLLSGAHTHQEATFLRNDLSGLLQIGGFNPRKWVSNDPSLVPENSYSPICSHMSLDPNSVAKTLGSQWNSRKNYICQSVGLLEGSNQMFNSYASRKSIRSVRSTSPSYGKSKNNNLAAIEGRSALGLLAPSRSPHSVAIIQGAISTSR